MYITTRINLEKLYKGQSRKIGPFIKPHPQDIERLPLQHQTYLSYLCQRYGVFFTDHNKTIVNEKNVIDLNYAWEPKGAYYLA